MNKFLHNVEVSLEIRQYCLLWVKLSAALRIILSGKRLQWAVNIFPCSPPCQRTQSSVHWLTIMDCTSLQQVLTCQVPRTCLPGVFSLHCSGSGQHQGKEQRPQVAVWPGGKMWLGPHVLGGNASSLCRIRVFFLYWPTHSQHLLQPLHQLDVCLGENFTTRLNYLGVECWSSVANFLQCNHTKEKKNSPASDLSAKAASPLTKSSSAALQTLWEQSQMMELWEVSSRHTTLLHPSLRPPNTAKPSSALLGRHRLHRRISYTAQDTPSEGLSLSTNAEEDPPFLPKGYAKDVQVGGVPVQGDWPSAVSLALFQPV